MASANGNGTYIPGFQASALIWKVVPPILIAFGTLGNTLSIVVRTRKSIRRLTIALYLTVLAASDLLVLYTGLLRQWLLYLFDFDIRDVSKSFCKIHPWLVYSSLDFSAWILIAVTLDRTVAAWFPHSMKTKCSSRHAVFLIVGILMFVLGLNSHLLYGMEINRNSSGVEQKCMPVNDIYGYFLHKVWPWIDFSLYCLIPFVLIVTGNCLIILKVYKTQRKRKRAQALSNHYRAHKQSSMTAMLFTLNIVFLITTSPVSIYNIIDSYQYSTGRRPGYMIFWWAIVNMLMYTNNAINFLLYCLSGSVFRKEAKQIFCSFKSRNSSYALNSRTNSKTHNNKCEHMSLVAPEVGALCVNQTE